MIPRSKDALIKWTDEDGAVFQFRPLVGDIELKVYEAYNALSVDYSPYIPQAEKEIEAKKGKRWKSGEKKEAIVERARELASKAKGDSLNVKEMRAIYDVIDLVVYACDGVTFGGDASQSFNLVENTKLFHAINEVNALSDDDKKN